MYLLLFVINIMGVIKCNKNRKLEMIIVKINVNRSFDIFFLYVFLLFVFLM